jgi:drug/metabolite transporter (DMT)-like permease
LLAALPLVCSGVLLISGVLETGAYGEHPIRGVVFGILTGLTYAGFILVLRHAGADLRRPAGPLFDATVVAAIAALLTGIVIGEADLVPTWPAHAWLITLALTSQVIGWLLIAVSLPRLPAALTSVTLTIQPVGSVLLGVILLGEHPSALQLAGVGCILAGLLAIASIGRIRGRLERGGPGPQPSSAYARAGGPGT